jgi:hypothetical protein
MCRSNNASLVTTHQGLNLGWYCVSRELATFMVDEYVYPLSLSLAHRRQGDCNLLRATERLN